MGRRNKDREEYRKRRAADDKNVQMLDEAQGENFIKKEKGKGGK